MSASFDQSQTTLVVKNASFQEHSKGNMGIVLEGLFIGDQTKTLDKLINYRVQSSLVKLVCKNPIDFTYMFNSNLSLTFKIS
jgi:hypothetical protein